jgi:hypothetical protein
MNMSDWQSQQRLQKEKERKMKTEASEILRSHRGGVKEDDAKFSEMRAEERKQKLEAESLNNNYRGKSNPNDAKVKPVRQDPTHPTPVNANATHLSPRLEVGNLCAPGSVSAMAGKFKTDESGITMPEPPLEQPHSVESITEEKKMEAEPVSENIAPVEKTEESASPELVMPSSSAVEAPEEPEIAMKEPEEEEAVATTTTDGDALLAPQDEPLEGHPTVVRLDVLFSFGLVTAKKKPSFAGYLAATEDIIKETLQENAELSEHVSYDSMYGPFVQECTVDGKSAQRSLCSTFN